MQQKLLRVVPKLGEIVPCEVFLNVFLFEEVQPDADLDDRFEVELDPMAVQVHDGKDEDVVYRLVTIGFNLVEHDLRRFLEGLSVRRIEHPDRGMWKYAPS